MYVDGIWADESKTAARSSGSERDKHFRKLGIFRSVESQFSPKIAPYDLRNTVFHWRPSIYLFISSARPFIFIRILALSPSPATNTNFHSPTSDKVCFYIDEIRPHVPFPSSAVRSLWFTDECPEKSSRKTVRFRVSRHEVSVFIALILRYILSNGIFSRYFSFSRHWQRLLRLTNKRFGNNWLKIQRSRTIGEYHSGKLC